VPTSKFIACCWGGGQPGRRVPPVPGIPRDHPGVSIFPQPAALPRSSRWRPSRTGASGWPAALPAGTRRPSCCGKTPAGGISHPSRKASPRTRAGSSPRRAASSSPGARPRSSPAWSDTPRTAENGDRLFPCQVSRGQGIAVPAFPADRRSESAAGRKPRLRFAGCARCIEGVLHPARANGRVCAAKIHRFCPEVQG